MSPATAQLLIDEVLPRIRSAVPNAVKRVGCEDVDELIVGSTLSEFEGGNSHFNQLFKCNNSIIVNINRVLWVEGNAAGYKLALHPKLSPVAVADDKRIKFKKLMEAI